MLSGGGTSRKGPISCQTQGLSSIPQSQQKQGTFNSGVTCIYQFIHLKFPFFSDKAVYPQTPVLGGLNAERLECFFSIIEKRLDAIQSSLKPAIDEGAGVPDSTETDSECSTQVGDYTTNLQGRGSLKPSPHARTPELLKVGLLFIHILTIANAAEDEEMRLNLIEIRLRIFFRNFAFFRLRTRMLTNTVYLSKH